MNRPCPFCGVPCPVPPVLSSSVLHPKDQKPPAAPPEATREWQVECHACGAVGPLAWTQEEAVKKWNAAVTG